MNAGNFAQYAEIYDAINFGKDYLGESRHVLERIGKSRIINRNSRILEVGCGTGHHASNLSRLTGAQIVGIDISADMIAKAKEGHGGDFAGLPQIDFRNVPLEGVTETEKFDAIILMYHVINYMTVEMDVGDIFSTIMARLKPGGVVFFDYWHAPGVLYCPPSIRIKRVSDKKYGEIVRIAEPILNKDRNEVQVNFNFYCHQMGGSIVHFKEAHRLKYLTPMEIDMAANSIGMSQVSHNAWLRAEAPTRDDWYAECLMTKA